MKKDERYCGRDLNIQISHFYLRFAFGECFLIFNTAMKFNLFEVIFSFHIVF